MIVLGGRDVDGLDIIGFEVKPYIIVFPYTNVKSIQNENLIKFKIFFDSFQVYDEVTDTWKPKPEWEMAQGRYRYKSVEWIWNYRIIIDN